MSIIEPLVMWTVGAVMILWLLAAALHFFLPLLAVLWHFVSRCFAIVTVRDARKRAEDARIQANARAAAEACRRAAEREAAEAERQREIAAAEAKRQREFAAAEAKRQRDIEEAKAQQRKADNLARALAAFPGHWTADYVHSNRYWPDSCSVEALWPPDVVVGCGEDGDIEMFKGSRVRAYEAQDKEIIGTRSVRAAEIREERRIRTRLDGQIRVSINDLPPLSAAEASHELEG